MRRQLHLLRGYLPRMGIGLIVKIFATVCDLLMPLLLVHVVEQVAPRGSRAAILLWGTLMVLCAVCARTSNIQANCMASRVGGDYADQLRTLLFSRTLGLSGRQLDGITLPSMVARLTADVNNVQNAVTKAQRMGIRCPLIILAGVCITATIDLPLSLVLLAVLPLIALITLLLSRLGIRRYRVQQSAADRLLRIVRENASGIRLIRALGKSADETARFSACNRENAAREIRASSTMAEIDPLVSLALNLSSAAVILIGAYRVSVAALRPASIIAVLYYFTLITNASSGVNRLFVILSRGISSAKRIEEVLALPDDQPRLNLPREDNDCLIEFRDVSFSYFGASHQKKHVEHISFRLRTGESLGIIGPTGCGKSTLLLLLLRFYDADSGQILVDGLDVRAWDITALRRRFGAAFQNDILFTDTAAGNIAFGRPLDRADLETAVNTAQAAFLYEKEAGLDAPITARGSNLSGGQRQRVLVARALAAHPDILLLDDASSALDYRTDAALRQAIAAQYPSLTSIQIAQRISAVRRCTCILVMEEGCILAAGSHEELMENCPAYREIRLSQTGGEADG